MAETELNPEIESNFLNVYMIKIIFKTSGGYIYTALRQMTSQLWKIVKFLCYSFYLDKFHIHFWIKKEHGIIKCSKRKWKFNFKKS